MIDRQHEVERRTAQFCRFIELMNQRAHDLAHGPCYMIFNAGSESEGEISRRFVQFSFEENVFHLDMPCQTLLREEAELIRRERKGFFYLSEGPEFTLHEEDVEGNDPFRAVYFYGDERSAADDMAFIFFDVWGLPVYSDFSVTAKSFDELHIWEQQHQLL